MKLPRLSLALPALLGLVCSWHALCVTLEVLGARETSHAGSGVGAEGGPVASGVPGHSDRKESDPPSGAPRCPARAELPGPCLELLGEDGQLSFAPRSGVPAPGGLAGDEAPGLAAELPLWRPPPSRRLSRGDPLAGLRSSAPRVDAHGARGPPGFPG